jgi:hypothetical protein
MLWTVITARFEIEFSLATWLPLHGRLLVSIAPVGATIGAVRYCLTTRI